MPLYRKFTTFVAGVIIVVMLVLCAIQYFTFGFSQLNKDTGELLYFYQTTQFLTPLLLALVFGISLTASLVLPMLPQVGALVSAVAFGVTFYEMAVGDMDFIIAAVVLLLAGIHVAGNVIDTCDRKQAKAADSGETTTQN